MSTCAHCGIVRVHITPFFSVLTRELLLGRAIGEELSGEVFTGNN
jgi:hypothetical protein